MAVPPARYRFDWYVPLGQAPHCCNKLSLSDEVTGHFFLFACVSDISCMHLIFLFDWAKCAFSAKPVSLCAAKCARTPSVHLLTGRSAAKSTKNSTISLSFELYESSSRNFILTTSLVHHVLASARHLAISNSIVFWGSFLCFAHLASQRLSSAWSSSSPR